MCCRCGRTCRKGRAVRDGFGRSRASRQFQKLAHMISHLANASLIMRSATRADAEPVWRCRRALRHSLAIWSAITEESFGAHVTWFSRAVNDPGPPFPIIEESERWLGYLLFDPLDNPTGYCVNIALVDDTCGAGVGEAALFEAVPGQSEMVSSRFSAIPVFMTMRRAGSSRNAVWFHWTG